MKLTTFHQILISSMIVLCALFTARGLWLFASKSETGQLVGAGISLLVGLGAAAYLRSFRAKQNASAVEESAC